MDITIKLNSKTILRIFLRKNKFIKIIKTLNVKIIIPLSTFKINKYARNYNFPLYEGYSYIFSLAEGTEKHLQF